MKRRISRALIALFLVACLTPSFVTLIMGTESAASNETLTSAPVLCRLDSTINLDFFQELSDYYSGRFAPRHGMITAYATIQAAVFGTSAAEEVLLGQEGWLFYWETLDDYLNTEPLTDREAWAIAHTLSLMQEYVQGLGGDFLLTIAPNKSSLYSRYLPDVGVPLTGKSSLEKLTEAMEVEGVAYADIFAPIRATGRTLYRRADSHWTSQGAALAHDTLLSTLGRSDGDAFTGDFVPRADGLGDLYQILYPAGTEADPDMVPVTPPTYTAVNPIRSAEDQNILTTSDNGIGTLLMFRDSFGNALYPYLASSFASARFSRAMPYRLDWLDGGTTDTVIVELVERNLIWLTEQPPVMVAPTRTLYSLAQQDEALTVTILRRNDGVPEGLTLLQGTLQGLIDMDSIYVQLNETIYEACPVGELGENSFSLYIPSTLVGQSSARVFAYRDNALMQSPLTEITGDCAP